MRKLIAAVFVTASLLCGPMQVRSEQDSGKLVFENDQMRAVEYIVPAGAKLNLQSHAPYLIFCVSPSAATLSFESGQTVRASFKVDDLRWYEDPLIGVTNRGKNEARFLIVEVKKPAPTNQAGVPADDATKLAGNVYKLLYENDRVRVIRVSSKPGQKTPMHSHPGSAFRYPLVDTKGKLIMPDGTIRELDNKTGVARWTEAPTRHMTENIGITKSRTLLIEIK